MTNNTKEENPKVKDLEMINQEDRNLKRMIEDRKKKRRKIENLQNSNLRKQLISMIVKETKRGIKIGKRVREELKMKEPLLQNLLPTGRK